MANIFCQPCVYRKIDSMALNMLRVLTRSGSRSPPVCDGAPTGGSCQGACCELLTGSGCPPRQHCTSPFCLQRAQSAAPGRLSTTPHVHHVLVLGLVVDD